MPVVHFTANLARQTTAPACVASGSTVRQVLESVFACHPSLKSYVLDDQQAVRKHVVVFVDGTAIKDRKKLSDPVQESSELFVMQALSGG